jgi:prepilin-type processing-associated H-X9-DG protein
MNLSARNPWPVRRKGAKAFARVDVLAIGLGLALLGMVALPTWGGFRTVGDAQWCVANFRQLTRGWQLYAEDHGGRLAGNLDGGEAMDPRSTNRTWASGWLDLGGSPANTNAALLRHSQLGPYVDSVAVYRCPADLSLNRGRTGVPRVRSVGMNSYVGQRPAPWTSGFRVFTNLNQIVDPSPATCLLFVDEREESVNDACFLISMEGYDPASAARTTLVDFPAARHEGGATMSFVDGHVETWRWVDARTRPGLRAGETLSLNVPMPNNPDVQRIQRSASRRIQSLP